MPLGNQPINDTLILTAGADFVHRINAPVGETIPVGTSAAIGIFPDQETATAATAVWPAATVTGSYVEWRIESEIADEIEDGAYFRLYVIYDDEPTLEHCWYLGNVERQQ